MKRARVFVVAFLILFAILSFSFISSSNNKSSVSVKTEKKLLSQAEELEKFLKDNNASARISQAYKIALKNPSDVLSIVKCYCGCLKGEHRNNRDCFINEEGGFDLMGLNCGLCVETAIISQKMLSDGKSVVEIAAYVDSRWGNR